MAQANMQQAAGTLAQTLLTPDERKRRERDLERIRMAQAKEFRKRYDATRDEAKAGYELANAAQDELYDAFKALAKSEGRMTAAEYQARYEELLTTQAQVEADRSRYRSELQGVGQRYDALDEDADAVIDDFFQRHSALPHPARSLDW